MGLFRGRLSLRFPNLLQDPLGRNQVCPGMRSLALARRSPGTFFLPFSFSYSSPSSSLSLFFSFSFSLKASRVGCSDRSLRAFAFPVQSIWYSSPWGFFFQKRFARCLHLATLKERIAEICRCRSRSSCPGVGLGIRSECAPRSGLCQEAQGGRVVPGARSTPDFA